MTRLLTTVTILAVHGMIACSNESRLPEATGKGTIQGINAIPTSPSIALLIEERVIGSIGYKSWNAPQRYDDLDYTFNFEVTLPGDSSVTRIASRHIDVVKDMSYLLLLSGPLASPTITVWERPVPAPSASDTTFEAQFAHAAGTMGGYDAYLAAPGTPPAVGEARATVAFGEISPVTSLEAGDYVLTVTAPGDPATVLYESDTLTPAAGNSIVFTTFDPDANDLAPVAMQSLNLVTGAAEPIADVNYPSEFRFFHAALDTGPVDIYVDDPLTTPLVADHAFGDITSFIPVSGNPIPLTYTTADNMGSILIDIDRASFLRARAHIFLIENSAGEAELIDYRIDLRSVETQARLGIVHTASLATDIDVYLVTSGTGIDEAVPIAAAYPPGLEPLVLDLIAGSYDLYVTVANEMTQLAGPVAVDLALGDVAEAHLLETPDPNVVDVRVLVP